MSHILQNETIAAISTGLTQSGISIIRVSGSKAVDIVDSLFINKKREHILKNARSHTLHYGFFCHGNNSVDQENDIIDEVLVSIMLAPKTYTGEDVVEVNCHGGIYVTSIILDEIIKNGAVSALPGEFTKRAFLNGRIDLTKAEAVMDMISSENELSRKISMDGLKGNLYKSINSLREEILEQVAYIEAALDDPEHYELTDYEDELRLKINDIIIKINELIDSYNDGKIIKNGIRTVILGKPNAGKSSLMNLLSGHERSIVTAIPGTTRDILEQDIKIRNLGITLVDTAGIHSTQDEVEKIGIERSLLALKDADLCLFVADSSINQDENDDLILKSILDAGIPFIVLLNKNDLNIVTEKSDIMDLIRNLSINKNIENNINDFDDNIIYFSVKDETGLDELKNRINKLFFSGNIASGSQNLIITNSRHYHELCSCKDSLKLVIESMDSHMPVDFYTVDLMQAYEHLGLIIGQEIGDDLADEIFSKFCMGK